MDFGIAKFRIAKFSHCEFGIAKFSHCEIRIGIANFKLALRNRFWHCEISHCEIFALQNWNWHCEFEIGIAKWILALRNLNLALRNWHCEIGKAVAKCTVSCGYCSIAPASCCLHPAQLHLIFFTFPLIFH